MSSADRRATPPGPPAPPRATRTAPRSRGEIVFHRGDPADSLHLVRKGRYAVRIVTPLGDSAMLSVRGPGDAFGELALIGEESVRSATVSALEPGETHSVYRADFERVRREHPHVNDVLLGILTDRLRRLSDQVVEAYYVPADRRVLRRVCELAQAYGSADEAIAPL